MPAEELKDLADEGDRPSITEVNGTVARFEMAFSPAKDERFRFGPPWWQKMPSFVFLGFASTFAAAVLIAYHGPASGPLYNWAVQGDMSRVVPTGPFAFLLCFSALATVIRATMRGVVVSAEGIEARSLLLGIPRVKRWAWPQIDRLIVDDQDVMLELWNGQYEKMPKVADPAAMASLLERIAIGRGREVTRLKKT